MSCKTLSPLPSPLHPACASVCVCLCVDVCRSILLRNFTYFCQFFITLQLSSLMSCHAKESLFVLLNVNDSQEKEIDDYYG